MFRRWEKNKIYRLSQRFLSPHFLCIDYHKALWGFKILELLKDKTSLAAIQWIVHNGFPGCVSKMRHRRDLGQCFMFSKLLIETQISFGYGKMARHSDSEARLSGCKPWLSYSVYPWTGSFQFSVNPLNHIC